MRSCAAAKDRAVPVPIPRRPVLGGPEVVRVGLNTDHTSKTPRGEPGDTRHTRHGTSTAHTVTGHTDRESCYGTVLYRSGTPMHSTHSVVDRSRVRRVNVHTGASSFLYTV